MRQLVFIGWALVSVTACGGDDSGKKNSNQNGAGGQGSGAVSSAGGSAGAGGATASGGAGTQCTGDGDCPQLGCAMCPASICVDGRCVPSSFPGSGGASGDLKWFSTCGPPVCRPAPGSGGVSSGIPSCGSAETEGASCTVPDSECDTGAACSGPLRCTTSDPTGGGQCPVSRAAYKTDIQYLTAAERAALARDAEAIPLVRYRYKSGPERQYLGFIIEDVEPSPSVDSPHDRVDLYGYTSMAIAALQEQRREIDALRAEVRALRGELSKRAAPVAPK